MSHLINVMREIAIRSERHELGKENREILKAIFNIKNTLISCKRNLLKGIHYRRLNIKYLLKKGNLDLHEERQINKRGYLREE